MMTISTYEKDSYVYLDISRHRRNFPPVDHVSSFGDYESADLAARARPADVFLNQLSSETCYYAYDRISSTPAYLSFKFPIKQGGASQSRPASETMIKILAIDDQPVILDLITAMCQSMGFRVETARTGEEGLTTAAKEHFDLVLTDLSMPDISGLEVARRIHRQYPETPIVLITGWEAGFEPEQLQATGITQVLYKPFRIEQLADIIKTAASRLAI
jgi:CheY-like chemotaxis protein